MGCHRLALSLTSRIRAKVLIWLLFMPLAFSSLARADDVLQLGDVAASGFAGVTLQSAGLPPGVDPATKTVIDPDGITLQIFDAGHVQQPLNDQQLPLPIRKTFKASEIGHVFGLVFDNLPPDMHGSPGLYATSTSAFGLQLVGPDKDNDGKPDRITVGAPGAKFMDGQFGPAPGGGGGAIWKVDSATGNISLYANVATNTGQGFGGIAFDPASRSIYVSDLDTGLIHQFVGSTSVHVSQFDHGLNGRPMAGQDAIPDDGKTIKLDSPDFDTTKPETWGLTPVGRRIEAMAVHGGRLFYATAGDHSIWSIGLGPDGSFQNDSRIEFAAGDPSADVVGSIVFVGESAIIAFRNEVLNKGDYLAFAKPGPSAVLRYVPETPDDPNTPSKWNLDPTFYPVGENQEHKDSSGGAALQYAYKPDGTLDTSTCSAMLVVSGDALDPQKKVHGLQIGPEGQFAPAPVPDANAGFIALDPNQDLDGMRAHAGGVAALTRCDGAGGFPAVADNGQPMPPVQGGGFPPVDQGGGGQTLPPIVTNPTFPPVGQPGTLTVTKSAAVDKCNPKGGCAFAIDVTNNGAEVPGPIVINDVIDAPQAALTGEPNAPWQCTKVAPFTCTHPGPVPANGKLSMRLVFAPNTPADVKEVKNCAGLPGAVPPGAQPAAAQQGQNQQPPVALPPPVVGNAGGLLVTSTPTGGVCSPTKGTCEFTVTVTNNGAVPITGPLTINETLAVGSQSQAKNEAQSITKSGAMVCTPNGRELNCEEPNVTLGPGESRVLQASFKVDTVEGGAAQFVQNHAVVSFGPLAGEAKAAVAFDDNNKLPEPGAPDAGQVAQGGGGQVPQQSCATIPLDPNAPFQQGPVVLAKKGAASCPLQGPCTFDVTLTNTSDKPVSGPIAFNDDIQVPGATLVNAALPAPFKCDAAGPPFKCTFGDANTQLAPKESKTVSLTFNLNLPAGTKTVKNCAVQPAPAKKAGDLLPHLRQLIKHADATPKTKIPFKSASVLPALRELILKADFAPQTKNPLLHLVDDPGGNIGGVNGPEECARFEPKEFKGSKGFSIKQSDQLTVAFTKLNIAVDGTTTGEASFFDNNGGKTGVVSGLLLGSHFVLEVRWSDGQIGHYTGDIGQDHKVVGTIDTANNKHLTFQSTGDFWTCRVTKFCDDNGRSAVFAASLLQNTEACRPDGAEPRWSLDLQQQMDFCMAHRGLDDQTLVNEEKARADHLQQCVAMNLQCQDFATFAAEKNAALKGLGCSNVIPNLDEKSAKAVCRLKPLSIDAFKNDLQKRLDTCKADLIAKGAGAGAGGDKAGGGAGGDNAGGGGAVVDPGANAGDGGAVVDPGANAAAGDPAPEQCAVVDIDENIPPPVVEPPPVVADKGDPQDQGNGLTIQKSASDPADCTAGIICAFDIKVTSKVPNQPGPIVVKDIPDNVAGLDFQADKPVSAVPNTWVCTKGDTITCTNPGPVPPEGLNLQLVFQPGAKASAKTFRNCASLDVKPGPNDGDLAPEPSCAEAPLKPAAVPPPPPANAPKLVLKKIADPCTLNDAKNRFECNFVITISNTGNAPFKGPITINEAMPDLDGAGAGVVTVPPWTCIGPDPLNPVANSCNNRDASIDAQGSITLPLAVTIPKDAKSLPCEVKNTATLEGGDAAQVPATATAALPNVKPILGQGGQGKCKLADKPAPLDAALPNLTIEKEVATAGGGKPMSCTVEGKCSFNIRIRNKGDGPFTGPISFTDAVQERLPQNMDFVPAQSPGWTCTGINNSTSLKCDHPVVTIDAGKQLPDTLRVEVTPGAATWKKNNTLTNCVALAIPAGAKGLGNDPGTKVDDDKSCPVVTLDPFNVKVTKTGDQSCVAGSDCHFQIKLFNPGPIDHNAPVTITDKLTGLGSAQIVSLSPDFPCATPPTQIPFSCTSPGPVRLDVDAKEGDEFGPKTYDMVVRLPADAAAGAFSNCADVLNDNVPTGQSCVSVQTKPAPPATPADLAVTKTAMSQTCSEAKSCDFKITVTNKSNQPYTGNISVFDLMAADAAPMTQYKFANTPAAPWVCIGSAAPGMQCNRPGPLAAGASVDLLLSLQPQPGSLGDAKYINNCANIDGQQSAAKSCAQIAVEKPVAPPPPAGCGDPKLGLKLNANGMCACPDGGHWNGQTCTIPAPGLDIGNVTSQPPPPAQCGDGQNGLKLTADGMCVCPAVTKWNGSTCAPLAPVVTGGKVTTPPPPVITPPPPVITAKGCPKIRPIGTPPNCCPLGTTYFNGLCRRPVVIPAQCPVGTVPDLAKGRCMICPPGTTSRAGVCVRVPQVCPPDRPNGTYPNCCPAGTLFDNHGQCRSSTPYCGPNQFLDPSTNMCVNRPQPPPQPQPQPQQRQITCPDGRVVTGYWMCRINRQRPPQPVVHNCPPGYRVLTTPNKYGAYCEIIPVTPPTPTKPPPPPSPAQPSCGAGKRFDPQAGPGGSCVLDVR